MIDPAVLKRLHLSMLRVRFFEETTAQLLEAGEIKTATHLYTGQEAIAAGVCEALRPDDKVLGTHRSHGHFLAKGGDMRSLMAEIMCRVDGCAGGRGGSMHLFDESIGFLGSVPMVGATIPISVGVGLAAQYLGSDSVAVCFFGDGATEEGVFHEALNFAALASLPVLFVCENNLFSSHLPLATRRRADKIVEFARPYDIPGIRLDGNDAIAIYEAARVAVDDARGGRGPTLLECRTYRWRGHVGPSYDLEVGIREKEELQFWMDRCPIAALERYLVSEALMGAEEFLLIREEVAAEVDDAIEFARNSAQPNGRRVLEYVFAE